MNATIRKRPRARMQFARVLAVLVLGVSATPTSAITTTLGDVVSIDYTLPSAHEHQLVGLTGSGEVIVSGGDPGATLPWMVLGLEAGAHGTLTVREGSVANRAAAYGRRVIPGSGPPPALYPPGSVWESSDPDAWVPEGGMSVGAAGHGRLTIIEGSSLNNGRFLGVGVSEGGHGTVAVQGLGSTLNIQGHLAYDAYDCPAECFADVAVPQHAQGAIWAGYQGGNGSITVSDGGRIAIAQQPGQPTTPLYGLGIYLGHGASATPGSGHGTLEVSGSDSTVAISGDNARLVVGVIDPSGSQPGHGAVAIRDGGVVTVEGGISTLEYTTVGGFIGTSGTLVVDGAGSRLYAGDTIGIGTNGTLFDFDPGNDIPGGSAQVQVSHGARLEAALGAFVGAGGELGGDGTIIGGLSVDGGTVMPGNSPGDLRVAGSATFSGSARIEIEIESASLFDRILATGLTRLLDAEIAFLFADGVDPYMLELLDLGAFFQRIGDETDNAPMPGQIGIDLFTGNLRFSGRAPGWDIAAIEFDAASGFEVTAAPVPLPPALPLLAAAFVMMGMRRRA